MDKRVEHSADRRLEAGHSPVGSQTNPVVLVVEDEPLQRMMAVDMVEDAGFVAAEAADAREAERILESRRDIRLVFTDVDMPNGMDGMQLASRIRDRWPPIHIILTSGHVIRRDVVLPSGAVFFPKPYRPAEIIAQIRRFMTED
ncbi:response regulator [Methylocella sp. CPCC 101449]|uniref:response regulator n=1 Tax=Methylocella sp. CPCC 101449 TaxID=2987531 RepID=UPI002891901A|nr:response regulator [Methylocella sp. CPCC 101449]MDT2023016.1 response regulator [Methylocella sp. CPCC 101449]